MAKKKMIVVEVEYDADQYFKGYDAKLREVAAKFDAEERGAGMGFGVRDTSYDVPEAKLAAFKKAMRSLKHVTAVGVRKGS